MVKKLGRALESAMMDSPNGEGENVRPSAGIRNGAVNHELLLQNQYLAAENRILRLQSFSENRSACLQDGINGGEVIRSTSVRRDRVAA